MSLNKAKKHCIVKKIMTIRSTIKLDFLPWFSQFHSFAPLFIDFCTFEFNFRTFVLYIYFFPDLKFCDFSLSFSLCGEWITTVLGKNNVTWMTLEVCFKSMKHILLISLPFPIQLCIYSFTVAVLCILQDTGRPNFVGLPWIFCLLYFFH